MIVNNIHCTKASMKSIMNSIETSINMFSELPNLVQNLSPIVGCRKILKFIKMRSKYSEVSI